MPDAAAITGQFGPAAAAYATSKVHAQGASLTRLVALLPLDANWRVLDVGTGAGHTALVLAPHVARVTAVDLTPQMLATAAALAAERRLPLHLSRADAAALPFCDNCFDLVSCRIAAHHFADNGRFLAEAARVLRPGGLLAIVDNIAPGTRLRGKKARQARAAAAYINAFEALRDPGHGRCLSRYEWQDAFQNAGFSLVHEETLPKTIDFHAWTARMQVPPARRARLQAMLLQAPEPVAAFLTPQVEGDKINFQLTEIILIGRLEPRD
jgi:ubiquinone/menaquinone biosynthesis C-methylase UbiE